MTIDQGTRVGASFIEASLVKEIVLRHDIVFEAWREAGVLRLHTTRGQEPADKATFNRSAPAMPPR